MTGAASCELSNTGLPVAAFVIVGLIFLLAGVAAFVVFGARGRRARAGGALVLLLVVAGTLGVAGGAPSAQAASVGAAVTTADDCPDGGGASGGGGGGGADNTLTIIQTSVNTGIVPGSTPTTLAGTITNYGTASAPITTVTVSIESVSKAPGAVDGPCDASDYVLRDAAMPVGRTLAPEEAAGFSGASIGFSEKGTNQDACKSATLHLLYVSS
ncbi:hypothetical protein B7R54_00615 [Subtercola boreus]|uniref:Uncharacterized protein n=1 Tax=Subtercola boreus TaxID=120213 RepID=A0A3E0VET3_9MICO|nr:hypothetical protein [Subtercola boreus]RFA07880.1 hypothetical protein B7R54_00615 [Subtercola boreus]TQL55265.1 hypothetical protein FB464_2828 [Subtercola boreus]